MDMDMDMDIGFCFCIPWGYCFGDLYWMAFGRFGLFLHGRELY
jgi:hypothetical protein